MLKNKIFNDIFLRYYKIEKNKNLENYDFINLLKEFLNQIDILENKKINRKLNLIQRSLNIIDNQIIKLNTFTNRAIIGINRCYQIIADNKGRIENTYVEIFILINNDTDLKEQFIDTIIKLLNKINDQNNDDVLTKINNISKYRVIIGNNEKDEEEKLNDIENNKKFLKEKNIYFNKYLNYFLLKKIIKILFIKKIRNSYLEYKKINENKRIKLIAIEKLKQENNLLFSKIYENEKSINFINIENDKNKENLNKLNSELDKLLKFELKKQYVYLISNDKGIYKIGKTNSIENRLKSLNTSHWTNFKIIQLFQCENMTKVENFLHDYYDENRININREFFKLNDNQLLEVENVLKIKFDKRIMRLEIN